MTKTDLSYKTASDLRTKSCAAARAAAHADPAVYTRTLAPTRFGFRHIFSKNYPQDLKMVQKVAPCDSLQSPLKITC